MLSAKPAGLTRIDCVHDERIDGAVRAGDHALSQEQASEHSIKTYLANPVRLRCREYVSAAVMMISASEATPMPAEFVHWMDTISTCARNTGRRRVTHSLFLSMKVGNQEASAEIK